MKKINRIWLAAALFLLSAAGLNAQVNPKPFVIPELKTWTGETGQFVPTTSPRIVYPKGSAELEKVAKALQADYADMFGTRCVIGAGSVVTRDIPDDSVAVGNPARVVRRLATPSGPASEA